MIARCNGLSTNFGAIVPGEAVWLSGYIGIYIGDGLVVESSPTFANKVQITAVASTRTKNCTSQMELTHLAGYIILLAKCPKWAWDSCSAYRFFFSIANYF